MKTSLSGYLQSRAYNRKLFSKVKTAIEALDFDAEASIDMSAKSQQPLVIVTGTQNGLAADAIHDILNEYFQVAEPFYVDEGRTEVMFRDAY